MTHLPQGGLAGLCPIYASNAPFESIGKSAQENHMSQECAKCAIIKKRQRAHKELKEITVD